MGSKLVCEVCEKEDAVGVACVPAIPYSAAYGSQCLTLNAHPYGILRANVACNGGPDGTADWFMNLMTFVGGQYVTLRNAMEQYPLTAEELL
jgi:hypothetical protein